MGGWLEDYGTCNVDCAYLRIPRMRKSVANTIIELCHPISVTLWTDSLRGRCLMIDASTGSAHRRTAMAQAVHRSLSQSGLSVGLYLQIVESTASQESLLK